MSEVYAIVLDHRSEHLSEEEADNATGGFLESWKKDHR